MSILVLGATGFIGRVLVQALSEAGEHVRAASRRPDEHDTTSVEWVACDLREPGAVAAALEGVTCAYYLVHSMGVSGGDFRATERQCAETFAAAATRAGCERTIYLGGVAPRGVPSEHLASRLEVGEILRRDTKALELRASMIVGNGSASWQIVRDLAARLPFMVLPRWLESKSCPVALADVVRALLAARAMRLPASAWFDLPGPDVMSVREMLFAVAELQGRRIPAIRIPLLTPQLSALWLKLVSGAQYPIARELVMGLRGDLLPHDHHYWAFTHHGELQSFRAAAKLALSTESEPSRRAKVLERIVGHFGHGKRGEKRSRISIAD